MRGSIGWHGLTGAPFVRGAHRYELQVRGVLSKTPRFVLRTHKDCLPSLKGVSVPPTPTGIKCYPSDMLARSDKKSKAA